MSDLNRPNPTYQNRTPWGWIIGGIVAVVVIVGAIYALGRHDNSNLAASNNKPTATRSDTTGSASGSGGSFSSQNSGTASPASGSSTR